MPIGPKRLRQVAVILPFLIATPMSLAQQPGGSGSFGISELFKKAEEPEREQPSLVLGRPSKSIERSDIDSARGYALAIEGRFEEAGVLYAEAAALALREDGDRARYIVASFCQANAAAHQGRVSEAKGLIEEAMKYYSDNCLFRTDHYEFLLGLTSAVYRAACKPADSEPILRRISSHEARTYGEDHPVVVEHAEYLGNNFIEQGKYAEAEETFTRKFSVVGRIFGPGSSEYAKAMNRLLLVYQEQGKAGEAERLFQGVLDRMGETLGPHHDKVAETLTAYANLLSKLGRSGEADEKLARAIGIRCRNGVVAMVASRRATRSIGRLIRQGV